MEHKDTKAQRHQERPHRRCFYCGRSWCLCVFVFHPMKSGFVSIVGRPNSGKSTLLNGLVGEKVSIVTNKPQTTRHVVKGIVTRPEGQIVFLDTPGIHKPIHRMNERMMKSVRESMSDVDIILLIVDVAAS